ncbi:O-methyltransferase-domain-containing protein [Irpex lacteus]|nr:O-methyltransferase-domain-containing protein [Irpex lacteus]
MTTALIDSPVSELRALSDLIKTSVDRIEALCTERGQSYPLSDSPFTLESEAPRMAADVIAAGAIIVSAAAQLIAAVRPPRVGIIAQGVQYHVSSCIRIVILLHVPEILRAAGPKGLNIKDIAAPTKVDPRKLARILRILATKHIFREIAPDVFAHNRLSSVIDTGKDLQEIFSKPESKHDNTLGIAAFLEHTIDGGLRSSYYLPEVLLDPKWAHSSEPNETAFNKALGTTLPAFEWTALPENAYKRKILAIGMRGIQSVAPADDILKGFYWQNLSRGSVVVDVGGGIGSKMLPLAKTFDHLSFVVQDMPDVIGEATRFWDANMPLAISSGKVQLQAYDFFTKQPIQKPAVFHLCKVLHDWADKYCIQILSHLRAAAGPETQLVVVDIVLLYALPQSTTTTKASGAATSTPPEPLLQNMGEANIRPYLSDMQMMTVLNGSERTAQQYERLFEESGWKLTRIFVDEGLQSTHSKIIGIPI